MTAVILRLKNMAEVGGTGHSSIDRSQIDLVKIWSMLIKACFDWVSSASRAGIKTGLLSNSPRPGDLSPGKLKGMENFVFKDFLF